MCQANKSSSGLVVYALQYCMMCGLLVLFLFAESCRCMQWNRAYTIYNTYCVWHPIELLFYSRQTHTNTQMHKHSGEIDYSKKIGQSCYWISNSVSYLYYHDNNINTSLFYSRKMKELKMNEWIALIFILISKYWSFKFGFCIKMWMILLNWNANANVKVKKSNVVH